VTSHVVVAGDIERTVDFCSEVLGGEVAGKRRRSGTPNCVRLVSTRISISSRSRPTPDKPAVMLDVYGDSVRFAASSNLQATDIQQTDDEWTWRGVTFLTQSPGSHGCELRRYVVDADDRFIEFGQPIGFSRISRCRRCRSAMRKLTQVGLPSTRRCVGPAREHVHPAPDVDGSSPRLRWLRPW
jgi:hypothetical protein